MYTYLHHLSLFPRTHFSRTSLDHASLLTCGIDMHFGITKRTLLSEAMPGLLKFTKMPMTFQNHFKVVGSQPLFSHLGVYFTRLTSLAQSKQENSTTFTVIIAYIKFTTSNLNP